MRLRGWPVTVLSRGELVCENGEPRGTPGRGDFLRCALPDMAAPKAVPAMPQNAPLPGRTAGTD